MNKQFWDNLGKLIAPVIEFLNDNFDPHTIIIIQDDRFDVFRGEMGSGIGYLKKTSAIAQHEYIRKDALLEWAKESIDSLGRLSYGEFIDKLNSM